MLTKLVLLRGEHKVFDIHPWPFLVLLFSVSNVFSYTACMGHEVLLSTPFCFIDDVFVFFFCLVKFEDVFGCAVSCRGNITKTTLYLTPIGWFLVDSLVLRNVTVMAHRNLGGTRLDGIFVMCLVGGATFLVCLFLFDESAKWTLGLHLSSKPLYMCDCIICFSVLLRIVKTNCFGLCVACDPNNLLIHVKV